MAVAITNSQHGVSGNKKTVSGTVTFDASYPTGGESFGLAEIGILPQSVSTTADSGINIFWDRANGNIKILAAGGTEAGSASDQSAQTAEFIATGV